jgi:hypothetical protein
MKSVTVEKFLDLEAQVDNDEEVDEEDGDEMSKFFIKPNYISPISIFQATLSLTKRRTQMRTETKKTSSGSNSRLVMV